MCPVCTVTVIAGLGISRLLGIDDVITSLWIGAFILSFSFITVTWIRKKFPNWAFGIGKYLTLVVIALMYVFVLVPLKLSHIIGIERNTLFGIDKIILGTFVGSVVFLIGIWADKYQRKKFTKIFFPFQKVIFPVTCLLVVNVIFYFITRH